MVLTVYNEWKSAIGEVSRCICISQFGLKETFQYCYILDED
jgi:hypothetical protein